MPTVNVQNKMAAIFTYNSPHIFDKRGQSRSKAIQIQPGETAEIDKAAWETSTKSSKPLIALLDLGKLAVVKGKPEKLNKSELKSGATNPQKPEDLEGKKDAAIDQLKQGEHRREVQQVEVGAPKGGRKGA